MAECVAQLLVEQDIDLAFFAECLDLAAIRSALGQMAPATHYECVASTGDRSRIKVCVRYSGRFWHPRRDLFFGVAGEYQAPVGEPFLVFAVHLPSQLRGRDRASEACRELAAEILDVEQSLGHDSTILIGDLNLDPFDDAVVIYGGLNAVMPQAIGTRSHRVVSGVSYPFFCNPMWSVMGRPFGKPPGTYFYDGGRARSQYWHTFDQVLYRPALASRWVPSDFRVVDRVGGESLLDAQGRPNMTDYSDHLPLVFRIREKNDRKQRSLAR